MQNFTIGQRWISETEPELGLGVLESFSRHQLSIFFPGSNQMRLYATSNAPIKRVEFRAGDCIQSKVGASILVESVEVNEGILTYFGDGVEITETELADTISFSVPEDRLIGGHYDHSSTFKLRYKVTVHQAQAKQSNVTGFVGGRIDLIPHQLYIAYEVSGRNIPRVLLADEVGLGKTIEACLILHRLHMTGRAERILIVLPESLVHQWFVELLRRFNLRFTLVDSQYCASVIAVDKEVNPFNEVQLVICSTSTLLENSCWESYLLSTNWDMLVVDEAHHLDWTPKNMSPEYKLVESLSQRSHGLLLLTATPEQLGVEGHFARLRLLDPGRYPDLDKFRGEQSSYLKLADVVNKLTKSVVLSDSDFEYLLELFEDDDKESLTLKLLRPHKLLPNLVDRHGTGRVIFRNSRASLTGFPKRQAYPRKLKLRNKLSEVDTRARLLGEFYSDTDTAVVAQRIYDFRDGPRILWLAEFLRGLSRSEKVLLICNSREKVLALHQALLEEVNVKAAVFHEELTLIQRDRNAAWFAEPDGAKILICSEIGSEGRNFQFAHNLVLFDLPLNPELLEQRIGRLDRIGQTEKIEIYMPYLEYSWMQLLVQWHHEGLNGVERSLKGGYAYFDKFHNKIFNLGLRCQLGNATTAVEIERLISESRRFSDDLEHRLSLGQESLIALNSFRSEIADELVAQINELDADYSLENFMNLIFDHFGINVVDIDSRTLSIKPGQLFVDSFPCLPKEGLTVTFDRSRALGREDIEFLTWDHPMVRGSMDLILSMEKGNCTMVVWKDFKEGTPALLIEAIYIIETVAPPQLHIDRFLPPTPLRVLVDLEGKLLSDQFSHEFINQNCLDEEAFRLKEDAALLNAVVPSMLREAKEHASEEKSTILQTAITRAHNFLDGEAIRLKELQKINSSVGDKEIDIAENLTLKVTRHIAKADLRLDAVRLILGQ